MNFCQVKHADGVAGTTLELLGPHRCLYALCTKLEAQRPAMQKLAFLIGDWSGEACVLRGPGQFVDLSQTEHAEFKSSRRE